MKKIIFLLGLCLSLSFKANANPNDDEFEKIAKDYTENYLSSHPEFATELGDHRFDGILTDYSQETRARMLANAKQVREALKKFDDYKQLTGANQVDARILRDNVDSEIFRLEELREADWNPLVYNQSLANSLYLLVARDFDSAQKRVPNLRQRMDGIPNVIKQAEANLQDPPRVHTETAIEQIQGAINLVRNGLDPLLNQAPHLRKDLAPIQEKTAKALEDYKKWLQEDLLKRSDGNFRLGAEKFRKKLRFALASDLSMEEIRKRADADLQQTQAAIYETALPLYKKYFPKATDRRCSEQAGPGASGRQHRRWLRAESRGRSDRFRQAAQSGVHPGGSARSDRNAGIQAGSSHRLLRFGRAAREKPENIFCRFTHSKRLDEGQEGIVLSREQQLLYPRFDRA